jgi:hypothetical protein
MNWPGKLAIVYLPRFADIRVTIRQKKNDYSAYIRSYLSVRQQLPLFLFVYGKDVLIQIGFRTIEAR